MLRLIGLLFVSVALIASDYEQDPQKDQYSILETDYVTSHILISHRMAVRPMPGIERNKLEAEARAEELLVKVLANPDDFADIAREESDGPTSIQGGYLGAGTWGKFDERFERAVRRLKIGEITKKPIESAFGFHIIRREPHVIKNYAARIFVTTFRGATNIDGIPYRRENRQLQEEESRKIIDGFAKQLTADNFVEMAMEHSDFRKADAFFGNFRPKDSLDAEVMAPVLEGLEYGEVSEVVKLSFGWAIFQRLKVERFAIARILIKHKDVEGVPEWMTRTREQARALAEKHLQKVLKKPKSFARVARKESEGLFKGAGGANHPYMRGSKFPEYDAALAKLGIDEIHPQVIDSPEGYVVLKRIAVD